MISHVIIVAYSAYVFEQCQRHSDYARMPYGRQAALHDLGIAKSVWRNLGIAIAIAYAWPVAFCTPLMHACIVVSAVSNTRMSYPSTANAARVRAVVFVNTDDARKCMATLVTAVTVCSDFVSMYFSPVS